MAPRIDELFRCYQSEIPPVSAGEIEKYVQFEELLIEWNSRMNLVSKASLAAAFSAHFVDSIYISDCAAKYGRGRVGDLGSGAGFPGVVFAVRYGREVSLFERTGKKRTFLEALVERLEVPARVCCEFAPSDSVEVVMARAVMPPTELLVWLAKRLVGGSRVIIPMAKEAPEQIESGRFSLISVEKYTLPQTGVERKLAVFELGSTWNKK